MEIFILFLYFLSVYTLSPPPLFSRKTIKDESRLSKACNTNLMSNYTNLVRVMLTLLCSSNFPPHCLSKYDHLGNYSNPYYFPKNNYFQIVHFTSDTDIENYLRKQYKRKYYQSLIVILIGIG